jgi:Rrf2 family protein
MRMSQGVEWGLHVCTVLALLPEGRTMPAARLAEFHAVPGAYLAKHLQAMAGAGIVESVPGRRGGYRLAKAPADIRLLDVVDAVEGGETAFRCTEIRQQGPAALDPSAYRKPCGIARAMWAAEDAWRRELAARTVADLLQGLAVDVLPEAAIKGAAWFQEAMR